jgi:hypothetical protein
MISSQYQWLSFVSVMGSGATMTATLIIVWMGWLRTRRIAFLVLAAWALSVMLGIGVQSFSPMFLQWVFGGGTNGQQTYLFMMGFNLIRLIISSALLLAGLGSLVFGQAPLRKSGET